MRTGGVSSAGLEIPFVDLPLDFSFPGAGGVRSTTATTSGTLVAKLERLTTPFTFDLQIVVDGRVMSITAGLDAALVDMVGIGASDLGDGLRDLPIVPAPPGACP